MKSRAATGGQVDLSELVNAVDLPALIAQDWPESGAAPSKGGSIRAAWRGDENPSLSLGLGEDGAWVFRDFGTGDKGNAYHYLTEIMGLEHDKAVERLQRETGNWQPPKTPPKRRGFTPISDAMLKRHQRAVEQTTDLPYAAKRRGLPLSAVQAFQIAAKGDDAVFTVPGPDGAVLGLKRRKAEADERGKYEYEVSGHGSPAWCSRDILQRDAILAGEGEFNAMVLSLALGERYGVMGAAGASAELHPEALKGKRVFLWADDDPAGENAQARWANQALAAGALAVFLLERRAKDACDVAAEAGLDELAKLYEALIERSERFQVDGNGPELKAYDPGIYEFDHGYAYDRGGGGEKEPVTIQLTNWLFTPQLRLRWPDGSSGERGELRVNGVTVAQIDLTAGAWNTRRDLLAQLGPYGALIFSNSSADIAKIRQYVVTEHRDLPLAAGVKSFGWHEVAGKGVMLYEDATWHQGETPPIFYAGVPVQTNRHKFAAPKALDGLERAKEAIKGFKGLMTHSAALGIMGYAAAAPFAPRLWRRMDGAVYFCYVEGEKETGKSSFIELCLRMATGSSSRRRVATNLTAYQYDVEVSNANNLLVFIDEYKRGESERLDELVRAHHDREVKGRGTGTAGKLDEYIRNAPMIVNGEGFSGDSATRSRGVIVYPKKRDRGDNAVFQAIREAPIEAFAHELHQAARDMTEEALAERFTKARGYAEEATQQSLTPRLKNGLTFVAFGLLILQERVDNFAFDHDNIRAALGDIAQNTLEGGLESKSNLEVFLEELAYALSTVPPDRLDSYIVPSSIADNLILRPTPCVMLVERVKNGKQAVQSPGLLIRLASESGFFEGGDTHKTPPFDRRCRGVRLKLRDIPDRVDAGLLVKYYEQLDRAYRSGSAGGSSG